MSEQLGALDKLIEAVEVGESATWHLFYDAMQLNSLHAISAFNGSLDAAKALHDALLPGWAYMVGINWAEIWKYSRDSDPIYGCHNQSPSRAWLLSILRAYRSIKDNDQ